MTSRDVIIRAATIEDLRAIDRCAKLAYRKYVERMDKEPAPMHADFKQLVASNAVSIAIKQDSFAGFVVFYEQDQHMHLENVAVQPDLAGQGIGRKLIEYVEHQAVISGISRIELYTNEMMHENFGLYKHLGFEETDRREEDGFKRVFFSKLYQAS